MDRGTWQVLRNSPGGCKKSMKKKLSWGGTNSITKSFKQPKLLTKEAWGGLWSSVHELIIYKNL